MRLTCSCSWRRRRAARPAAPPCGSRRRSRRPRRPRQQRLLRALAGLQEAREVAARAQLRDRQLDRPDPRIEPPRAVAVAIADPLLAALVALGAGLRGRPPPPSARGTAAPRPRAADRRARSPGSCPAPRAGRRCPSRPSRVLLSMFPSPDRPEAPMAGLSLNSPRPESPPSIGARPRRAPRSDRVRYWHEAARVRASGVRRPRPQTRAHAQATNRPRPGARVGRGRHPRLESRPARAGADLQEPRPRGIQRRRPSAWPASPARGPDSASRWPTGSASCCAASIAIRASSPPAPGATSWPPSASCTAGWG